LSLCAHGNARFRLQTPGQRPAPWRAKSDFYQFHNYIEEEIPVIRKLLCAAAAALLLVSSFAHAEVPWTFSNNTRYLAMGDSLAAGYGAIPVTQGYAYLLYQGGTFDAVTNTIFANAAVPGVTSLDVLEHQVPQATIFFKTPEGQPPVRRVVTISVGGNDLLTILKGEDPGNVLRDFHEHLLDILRQLRAALPDARIIVGNQYDIPEITTAVGIPGADHIIPDFNEIIRVDALATRARMADVFSAFQGRNGLLLVERHGAASEAPNFEVHPTNAGYRVMAKAFAAAAATGTAP
jgi:lysophospholipase L1-like esterase